MTTPHELPSGVRTQRTLARWIWTLYRDTPGLSESQLVALTGADQAYINRSVRDLLSVGLLIGTGPQRRASDTVQEVTLIERRGRPPAAPGRGALERSEQRVYQVRSRAAARCASLNSRRERWFVFMVRAAPVCQRAASPANRAAGTVYVVARRVDDVPSLVRDQARHAALFEFAAADPARRPDIRQVAHPDSP